MRFQYQIISILMMLILYNTLLQGETNAIKPVTPASNKEKTEKGIKQETLDFWKNTIKYGTSKQKLDVIAYIQRTKIRDGEKIIQEHIKKEQNPRVIKSMASALVTFSNKTVIPFLIGFTKKTNPDDLKIFGLSKLGELRYKGAHKHAIELLDSDNFMLVEAALRTLGKMEAKEAVDVLLKKLEKEKLARVRTQIILALANIKSEKSLSTLTSIFTNTEETEFNRGYAATGLGYLKNNKSYDLLVKYYPDASPIIKERILGGLGNIGNKKAVNLVIESLKDDDENVRYYGIIALGKLNAKEAIEILEYKEKHDPNLKVRKEAKKVLIKLRGEKKEKMDTPQPREKAVPEKKKIKEKPEPFDNQ